MGKAKWITFKSLCKFYKKEAGLDYPLSIRVLPLSPRTSGDCYFDKKFQIRINKSLSEDSAIDTLIHEMGHCFSYFKSKEDHDYQFAKAYVVAYKLYLDWIDSEEQNS
jgi:Zn-dependent peptidase ImmA (M78 family)